jgi:Cu/Ag efflux pump CusA
MVQIYALPQVGKPAAMVNPVASDSRALAIGLTSDKMSLIDLSVLARWTIAPRLMGLPGVANVSIWGERQRQLQVQIDPEKLRAEKLTLMQIVETAGNSLWASPLSYLEASTPGTGGWIETPNQRLGVRHILPIQKAADLAKVPVVGAPTKRLGDVARLIEDHQPLIGDAFIKDVPSLMLVVEKFPWANSRDVTNTVERALGPLRLGLAGTQLDPTLFRPATFIELAEKNLAKMFLIGAFLSAAVFFAFFANWRTGLITTLAAATSTFVAAVVLYVRGVEANLLIATGLMLGLSVIIDDAILDVENIGRRLRDARERGNGRRPASIIGESLMETRQPLLYATAIMALAVAPLLFLEGFSRAFLEPLALSYLLALAASLAVALTLTPALSLLFLRDSTVVNGESALARGLRGVYRVLFGWSTRAPWGAIAAAAVLAVVGVALYPYVRQESLMPDLKETDLVVRMAGAPATSHPAISRITTLASHELRGMTGVRNVSAHVGRAIMSDKASNINASEIWISIDPAADYETTVANIRLWPVIRGCRRKS